MLVMSAHPHILPPIVPVISAHPNITPARRRNDLIPRRRWRLDHHNRGARGWGRGLDDNRRRWCRGRRLLDNDLTTRRRFTLVIDRSRMVFTAG
jgi:hypothetical protein